MPYEVRHAGSQFCVYNKATGKRVPGGCHPTSAEATKHMRAMYANVPDARKKTSGAMSSAQERAMGSAQERDFSSEQRDKLASKGAAMKGGGFPIVTRQDLLNAIKAVGRAKNPAAAKAHIIKRARALGLTSLLPADWTSSAREAREAREASEGPIQSTVQQTLGALEAVWTDNAEGLPQADVVIIRPGESANRRFYSKEAIAKAVHTGFWNNTPMFVDHGTPGMPRKRSVKDLMGRLENTYLGTEGEARGRVTFFDPVFAKVVKAAGPAIGLSAVHEFLGQRFRGNDGHMHENVHEFKTNHSVDFVAFPAAGGEIAQFMPAMESESEDDVDWKNLTREMLEEHQNELKPEVAALLAAESDGGDDGDDEEVPPQEPPQEPGPEEGKAPAGMIAMESVNSYIDEQVDRRIAALRKSDDAKAETARQVRELVVKAGLPEPSRESVIGQFSAAESFDQEAVQKAIDHKAEELKAVGWHGPKVEGLGSSSANSTSDSTAGSGTVKPWEAFESQMEYTPATGKKSSDKGEQTGKAN